MGFFVRYFGLGLLPLWIAILVVFTEGFHGSGEYWSVAPWLIVFAIPCCAVSLAIVALISWATPTRARQDVTHDDAPHHAAAAKASAADYRPRAWIATGVIFSFCLVVFWIRYQAHRENQALKQEQQGLKSFVMHNATVLAIEPDPHFWMPGGRYAWNDAPFEYEVGLRTEPYLAAIVLARHTAGHSSFSLECITNLWMGQRDSRLGRCQRPIGIQGPSLPAPAASSHTK